MKLVVGLGNPGPRYAGTRHNVGFDVVSRFAEAAGIALSDARHHSVAGSGAVPGALRGAVAGPSGSDPETLLLLLPQTWMNRSGDALASALSAHSELEPARDLLVVFDDLDLPLGRLRIRHQGGAGGHNGLADVLRSVGAEAVPRLRFGIGRPPPGVDPIDHVLARWEEAERASVAAAIDRAADAVHCFAREGTEAAMNRFNSAPRTGLDEPTPEG
ncbi:MAG: aminoacyl-tRNA hydrolase [Myxococcota bacterium]|nr:aminoacyl-tRNA hydrolase [Myxococcota bacterium]